MGPINGNWKWYRKKRGGSGINRLDFTKYLLKYILSRSEVNMDNKKKTVALKMSPLEKSRVDKHWKKLNKTSGSRWTFSRFMREAAEEKIKNDQEEKISKK